ncbi:histidine--tRNA ligase [Candidatus Peregrinibacteria bacterium CG22_combo_CG10-13_8_21_14_all_44_10]|nr:MAG: histidine--tRNA ligase [Candidatus Peregrinibacteria bacterium CG2_30_44_17]PIP66296.1 MAG: histidine--tRNA ligase [Candidatus Peregrinibacteria bacterium CG22_combo_CG10-13_8_21_14_all_44_10]PIS04254.1 MAG: histidine--tRNA ligase [Candidatus Peregrinibacteria bacterium CG10_big_fil_rev_8_21_14_0_10_44_7]PIX80401.1 MAG: histidine--tRNA ligase [Candidatus Peregrinibacteria bacterium CG_4_10_14_3_um_filter_44_21]PJB89655.1 MAG: histidine--tRNA ligase [Candidatus Peregrinibacteria bacteriu
MSDDTNDGGVKQQKLQTPVGIHDLLPDDHEYFTFIKKVVRHRARQAGFKRITTPILENTEVFARGVGDATDIVSKEMYTFEDKGERSLTLKPEGTAGVVRSYIQHGMKEWPQPVQLYYIEPHFRYDKPQKGRYRQFWQIGFEIIGESDPALDAQIIDLANRINEDLGVAHLFSIQLNNIGCPKCRGKYKEDLVNFYIGKERSLCGNCQERLHNNPLRLLDCKSEDCQILAELAPKFDQYRCPECVDFYTKLKGFLDELAIEYVENPKLVRGLDYYTGTVFEFWDKHQGAQNAIGGGGRYDGLIELMGGPPTPGVGYASGIERIILNMKRENVTVPSKDAIHIFVAQLGDDAKRKCLPLMNKLRDRGIKTVGALGKASMKAQLRLADKFNVPYTLIMGITEVREGVIIIRDMAKGQQHTVSMDEVVEKVAALIGEENLDNYSPGEAIY